MADAFDVLDSLQQITELRDEEKSSAESLCSHALLFVTSRLKADADPFDSRITAATAAQAFFNLCVKRASRDDDGVTSFKAGDLTVSKDSAQADKNLALAKELRDEAFLKLLPLLNDESFFFEKVDI